MHWLDLVALLALGQYFYFATVVGRARGRHGVKAPAVTGHPEFERAYRVQMNTLELLVLLLPGLYIAARYWPPAIVALAGVVFIVGRVIYFRSYMADPSKRTLGFFLSVAPALTLLVAAAVGAFLAAIRA